jgi:hypothetical protein
MRKTRKSFSAVTAATLLAPCLAASGWAQTTSTWTELFSNAGGIGGVTDTGLSGHSAVYDAATNTMIAFGGNDASLNFATTNAVILLTWANGLGGTSSFSTLVPNGAPGAPPSRAFHSGVYDAANNRMIIFGGATYANGHSDPTAYLNDVWVLANANGQGGPPAWTRLIPAGSPPSARYGQTAVYDAAGNRLIMRGGSFGSTIFTDAWVLTNANGLGGTPAWRQLSPGGAPPPGGYGASAVYDAADNLMVLFGGYNLSSESPLGFVLFNGVWTLSHANGAGGAPHWTKIVANGAPGSPGKRDVQTTVYDSAHNRLIVCGGGSFTPEEAPSYNDVWVLNGANGLAGTPQWTQLRPSGAAPGRRAGHTAVYDSVNNRMIVFAGASDDAQFYSAWILTGANGL